MTKRQEAIKQLKEFKEHCNKAAECIEKAREEMLHIEGEYESFLREFAKDADLYLDEEDEP